ncbi:hypothetical protein [Aliiroseovarius sp.]|uniref:hypothetical protein n=1 Tax=Aliiroseovarius sp. TaxID=1872442 RepID=UPI003BAB7FC1
MGIEELFLCCVAVVGLGLIAIAFKWPKVREGRFPVVTARMVLACVLALITFWGLK